MRVWTIHILYGVPYYYINGEWVPIIETLLNGQRHPAEIGGQIE